MMYNAGASRYTVRREPWSPGWVIFVSMLVALAWPVIFTAVTITSGQPATAAERKAKAKLAEEAAAKKARDLEAAERELGAATAFMSKVTSNHVSSLADEFIDSDNCGHHHGDAPSRDPITMVKNSETRRERRDPLSKKVRHD